MKRTTVMLPEDTLARLRLEARRRGVSIAEVMREAVDLHVPAPEPGKPLGFFGVGATGEEDASEQVEESVADVVRRRHRAHG